MLVDSQIKVEQTQIICLHNSWNDPEVEARNDDDAPLSSRQRGPQMAPCSRSTGRTGNNFLRSLDILHRRADLRLPQLSFTGRR